MAESVITIYGKKSIGPTLLGRRCITLPDNDYIIGRFLLHYCFSCMFGLLPCRTDMLTIICISYIIANHVYLETSVHIFFHGRVCLLECKAF